MTERYSPEEQQVLEIEGTSGVDGEKPSSGSSGTPSSSAVRDHILIRFLSSLILAIVLFLTLAFLTIFGTFIDRDGLCATVPEIVSGAGVSGGDKAVFKSATIDSNSRSNPILSLWPKPPTASDKPSPCGRTRIQIFRWKM